MQKNLKITLFLTGGIILTILAFLFDQLLLQFTPIIQLPFLNSLFLFLGDSLGLLIFLAIIGIFFLIEKKPKLIPYLAAAAILSILISYGLKYLIQRPRPILDAALLIKHSYSFPSTHAFIAASTYFFLRKLKSTQIIALVLAFLVAITGFYNGVHYVSDILAGVALGLMVSYFTPKLITSFQANNK